MDGALAKSREQRTSNIQKKKQGMQEQAASQKFQIGLISGQNRRF
jgi:hypothetical protein